MNKLNSQYYSSILPLMIDRIMQDNPKAKRLDNTINYIKCPVCGEKSAFFNADKGLCIICHRCNNCGAITPPKEYFPELFQDFSKRFPKNEADPKATARAYLNSRELNTDNIEFEQDSWFDKETKQKYDTVKFYLRDDIFIHRLIDYTGKDRYRFQGSYSTLAYSVTKDHSRYNEIYVCEGILDTLSLYQAGKFAIATLSCVNVPINWYLTNRNKKFILAFDNDKAGRKATEKNIKFLKENNISYSVIFPLTGKDWNDLLQINKLNDNDFKRYEYQGRLFLAEISNNSDHYFKETCLFNNSEASRIFLFNGILYKGHTTKANGETIYNAYRHLDCCMSIKYAIVEEEESEYQQSLIYRVIIKKGDKSFIRDIRPKELINKSMFDEFLLNNKCLFFGSDKDLLLLRSFLLKSYIPLIRKLKTYGHDSKSDCYVFTGWLIDKNGDLHWLNDDDVFEKFNIAPVARKSKDVIDTFKTVDLVRFIDLLFKAYQERGIMVLGFYIASAFAKQIADKYNFFPILSLFGDAHTGKSFMTKLFNNCFFFKKEGESFSKSTTAKAIARICAKKSNSVVSFLEGNKDKYKNPLPESFILNAWGRLTSYAHAKRSVDFEVIEKPLNSTLKFVQNYEFFTELQEVQRIISIEFLKEHRTPESKEAFNKLKKYTSEELAYLGLTVLQNRVELLSSIIHEIESINDILVTAGIDLDRISYNHAIVLSAVLNFLKFIKYPDYENVKQKTIDYAIGIARKKMEFESEQDALAQDVFERIFNGCEADWDYIIKNNTLYLYRLFADEKIKISPREITRAISQYRLPTTKETRSEDLIYFARHSEQETKKIYRRCNRFSLDDIYRKFGINFAEKNQV